MALEAMRLNLEAPAGASAELHADKAVILKAVHLCAFALRFAPDELKADREAALKAVKLDGAALWRAARVLKANIEVFFGAEMLYLFLPRSSRRTEGLYSGRRNTKVLRCVLLPRILRRTRGQFLWR